MNRRFVMLYLTLFLLAGVMGCSSDEDTVTDNPLVDSTKIDNAVGGFMSSEAVVGLSVAVIKVTDTATVTWSGEYGMRDVESQQPVDATTSFWMGSVSKAVQGVALVLANEQGLVKFDQDIHELLSAHNLFSLSNPENHGVTLANLTSHTSGIVDNDSIYSCAYYVPVGEANHQKLVNLFDVGITCPASGPVSLEGFLAAYLDANGEYYNLDLNFHESLPGERYEYSNVASGLAGYLVEAITGQDLATYARAQIFTPLSMTNTSWTKSALDADKIATPYVMFDGEMTALPVYELATWPDGGLRSNAREIAQLLGVVMADGVHSSTGARLLSEDSLSTLLPTADQEIGVFWSREESIEIDGTERQLIGHTGSDPGAFSLMFFDPVSRTGIVVAGNGDDDYIDDDSFEKLVEDLFAAAGNLR